MSTAASSPSPDYAPDIEALLVEFDSSGQSAASFARAKGLPSWKLYSALNRRRGKKRARSLGPVRDKPELIPVRIVAAAASSSAKSLELLLASGHRVLVPADFDELSLRRLVGALTRC